MPKKDFDRSLPDPLMAQLSQAEGTGKFFWFDSVDSIANAVLTINRWSDGPWSQNNYCTEEYGTKDMEQAITFLRYGWDKAVDNLDLTDVAISIPREIQDEFARTASPTGAQVDVGMFLTNQPECMYDFMPNINRKKTVRLFMNMSADCCGSDKRLWERGKAIAACIDWLERSGYRVRLDVGDCFSGYGTRWDNGWCIAFCAKDYSDALDIDRVSFMTGSSSMLNRIFFGIESSSAAMLDQFHGGYGGVAPVPKIIRDDYDYIVEYGAPFTHEIAAAIVEQIVTGQQPKEPPIIDDSDHQWADFETYDNTPATDMEVPIFRTPKFLELLAQGMSEAMALAALQGDGSGSSGGEGGDGGGSEPLQLYHPPTPYHAGYWYTVKPGPKTEARSKADKEKYGQPPAV